VSEKKNNDWSTKVLSWNNIKRGIWVVGNEVFENGRREHRNWWWADAEAKRTGLPLMEVQPDRTLKSVTVRKQSLLQEPQTNFPRHHRVLRTSLWGSERS
jgi:hypothetical protein